MQLDPHARRLLRLISASQGSAGEGRAVPDLASRRKGLADLATASVGHASSGGRVDTFVCPGPGGALAVRRYAPAAAGDVSPALVYLHGGGWCAGNLDTHDSVCHALATAGDFAVLAVDYRLAPEHPFPAALEDAIAAFDWVSAQGERLGVDPTRLAIGGDSAGGALAVAAASALSRGDRSRPALQVLICPILDVAESRPSRLEFAEGFFLSDAAFAQDLADYLPAWVDPADPRVSPLREPSLAGLPPAQLHLAAFDPFRDEGLDYAARLSRAGVEASVEVHPGMIHYFYALPGLIPYARTALEQIGRTAGEALRRTPDGL